MMVTEETGIGGGGVGLGLTCAKTVKAAVVSASEPLTKELRALLLFWARSECVQLSVETADRLPTGEKQDAELVFLDMDSMELPERERLELSGGLIVISRDAGRAIRSYRWHPAAFLKPDFDMRRLEEAMSACEKNWQRGRLCLEAPYRRRTFRLPLGRVRYVEAAAHYCLFDQGKQTLRFRFSIDELERLLPSPPFVRCHRSFLVRVDAVEGLSYTAVTLRGGTSLPLGRTYIKSLRAALAAWQREEPCNDRIHPDL